MRYIVALGLALGLPFFVIARDTEETPRSYLAASDVVVLGEFTNEPSVKTSNEGVAHYQADFKIAHVIKWEAPGEAKVGATIRVHIIRYEFEVEDRLPEIKKGGKCTLFLECHDLRPTPSYITADVWFGVQQPRPVMAKTLERIVAEQKKTPLLVPAEKDIEHFYPDPVQPNVHFKDFKIEKADLVKTLRDYQVIPKQDWIHNYSHVQGGDRTGTIVLRDRSKIEYMVNPGGLATLTFFDGRKLFLVSGK